MLLYISRHPMAKPQDDTVDDEQRQVTKRGEKQFRGAMNLYRKAGEMKPDVIFSGPETRNMQAAEMARDEFGLDPSQVVQSQNLAVDGDPKKAWDEIQQWVSDNGDPDKSEVMVVGSNPNVAALFQIVHGLGTKAGESGAVKLKKGSVAKIKVQGVNTDDASSELRSYVPPGLARGKK
jgi:phosphohistidine phosphatase SixA